MTGLCCSKRSQSSSDQDQGLSIYLSQSGGAVAVRGRSAMHSQNSVPVHSGSTLSAARPPAAVSQSLRPPLTPPPPPPTRPPAFWEPDHSFGFRETPGIKTALWSPPVCVRAPVYAAPVPIPARDDQSNRMDRNTYLKVPVKMDIKSHRWDGSQLDWIFPMQHLPPRGQNSVFQDGSDIFH